jgi:hypothetical protein
MLSSNSLTHSYQHTPYYEATSPYFLVIDFGNRLCRLTNPTSFFSSFTLSLSSLKQQTHIPWYFSINYFLLQYPRLNFAVFVQTKTYNISFLHHKSPHRYRTDKPSSPSTAYFHNKCWITFFFFDDMLPRCSTK